MWYRLFTNVNRIGRPKAVTSILILLGQLNLPSRHGRLDWDVNIVDHVIVDDGLLVDQVSGPLHLQDLLLYASLGSPR